MMRALALTFRTFLAALWLVAVSLFVLSCGSSAKKSTGPTSVIVSLAGTVTDATSNAAISSASVAVQGKSATTGTDGRYAIGDLTAGSAELTVRHQGHENVSRTVTLTGATTVDVSMIRPFAAGLAGNWTGQWRNTTFGTSGGATMVVTVDTIAQTFQVTLDLNGIVFGVGDPPPLTFSGGYTGSGATVTFTSTVLGSVTFTISPTGQISGSATSVPGGAISRIDFTGTATSSTIVINYTMTFAGGATATGDLTLNKI